MKNQTFHVDAIYPNGKRVPISFGSPMTYEQAHAWREKADWYAGRYVEVVVSTETRK